MKRSRVIEVELEYNQQEREDRRQIIANGGGDDDTDYVEFEEELDIADLTPPGVQLPPVSRNMGKSESAIQLGRGGKSKTGTGKKTRKLNRAVSHGAGVRQQHSEAPPSDVLKQAPGRSKRASSSSPEEMKEDFMSFGMTKEEKARMGDPAKLASHLRQLNDIRESQSQTELELEEVLKIKFEQVVGRRSQIVMENSKNRYIKKIVKSMDGSNTLGSDMSSHMLETLESASFNSAVPNEKSGNPVYGGISGLGLEYLTDSDRKDVMVNLLSNPVIFEEVVHQLQAMYFSQKYGSAL
jgi:hypothetical protein